MPARTATQASHTTRRGSRSRDCQTSLGHSWRRVRRFVQYQPVGGDDFGIEVRTVLRRALQTCEVYVHNPKALGIAERPLEIVEERPYEVAAQIDAALHGGVDRLDMLAQIVDAQGVLDAIGRASCRERV